MNFDLAKNPEKQEKLRQECQSLGENLTIKNLDKMRYTKACIKEAMRLTPTVSGILRVLNENVNIKNYEIPAGTMVMWFHSLNNYDEQVKYYFNYLIL